MDVAVFKDQLTDFLERLDLAFHPCMGGDDAFGSVPASREAKSRSSGKQARANAPTVQRHSIPIGVRRLRAA